MKIKIIRNVVDVDGLYAKKGDVVEVSSELGNQLVKQKAAVAVPADAAKGGK